jgi:hypothetical protein
VLDRVSRRDGYSMKKTIRLSARGAAFHTKHALNANIVRVVFDANSYLVYCIYNFTQECALRSRPTAMYYVVVTIKSYAQSHVAIQEWAIAVFINKSLPA